MRSVTLALHGGGALVCSMPRLVTHFQRSPWSTCLGCGGCVGGGVCGELTLSVWLKAQTPFQSCQMSRALLGGPAPSQTTHFVECCLHISHEHSCTSLTGTEWLVARPDLPRLLVRTMPSQTGAGLALETPAHGVAHANGLWHTPDPSSVQSSSMRLAFVLAQGNCIGLDFRRPAAGQRHRPDPASLPAPSWIPWSGLGGQHTFATCPLVCARVCALAPRT